jgi:hypothetical protein
MRVDRNDRIAGLPAPMAREVMRLFDRPSPESLLRHCIKEDDRDLPEIAQALASEGLLEFDHTDADGETWWHPTTKGTALAQASFRPPVTRATAERLLKEVIERAQCFNAAPRHLVEIAELVVFGSYLDPTVDRLGDLDLAVKFRELRADLSPDEYMKKRLAYARASGRQFNNFNAKLSWPENEATNRGLSIPSTNNAATFGSRSRSATLRYIWPDATPWLTPSAAATSAAMESQLSHDHWAQSVGPSARRRTNSAIAASRRAEAAASTHAHPVMAAITMLSSASARSSDAGSPVSNIRAILVAFVDLARRPTRQLWTNR